MRITILGGFLGAGKTTLLNRILASEYSRDAVVLVNDFGKVSIDSRLVAPHSGRLITLANGCICCSIGNDFVGTLIRITRQPELPRRLIVEASGVADPAIIGEFAATDRRFTLEAIVVLVDASSFVAQHADPRIGELIERQLAAADLIVLNKMDLVSDNTARELESWLSVHLPRRPVFPAAHSDVPLAALFDDGPQRTVRWAALLPPDGREAAPFESFVFESDRPFEPSHLERAIGMLPSGVLRGKGILRLSGRGESTVVFQMVGPRWSLVPAGQDVGDMAGSQLVLLGLKGSLKPAALHRLFSSALAPA